jgi:formylglycine-generating enzyme required for sulfatase activity
MALTWLQMSRSAKPKSCSPMIRLVSLFMLTLFLYSIVASSAYATPAAKTQAAASAVVSGSATAGKVEMQDFGAPKELPGENQSVMETIIYGVLITLLSAFIIAFGKWLYKRIQSSQAAKDLAPYFSKKDVQQKLSLFIESNWQNNSPTREEEPLFTHKFVSKSTLIPHFISTAFNENKVSDKFYLVLADSGMGKTTFMINLYVRYHSVFNVHKKYKIKLIPFGYQGNVIEKIKEIKKEEIPNTILLLDAFDEYTKILPPTEADGLTDDERFRQVLDEVIETVQDFREVVITSRTQYFPGEEDQPYELNIPTFDNKGFHTLAKFYLSPFDDKEIRHYLNKKYGIVRVWNRKKKQKARRIVHNSPKLMVRPMLLSYIDYLVDGDQHYANTYDIYEALINKWIEREGDKREHQHVNREKLKQNLHQYSQLVAVKIYEQRKEKKSLQLCKADATDVNVELKDYQMTGQSLLTRDADNNWKFAHKSILEFFLAKEALDNDAFARKLDFAGMDMAYQFWVEAHAKLYPDFVYVKGGAYVMGSPQNEVGRGENEMQHSVTICDLFVCKYAVTVAEFKRFIDESNYQTDAEKANSSRIFDGKKWEDKAGINWRHGVSGNVRKEGEYNHPVLHVSWNDAVAYCEWLSKQHRRTFRLPTEAEWEYACRAGTTTPFNTGENITTDQANFDGNYPYSKNKKGAFRQNTVSADSLKPNKWGLYNMHGNVWEWCSDWYGEKYYDECQAKGSVDNPGGPETGSRRVLRGGSWYDDAEYCRSAYRNCRTPDYRNTFVGFRPVFVP